MRPLPGPVPTELVVLLLVVLAVGALAAYDRTRWFAVGLSLGFVLAAVAELLAGWLW